MEVNGDPLIYVRRAAWGVLYADDAGSVSKSAEALAKMTTVIVTVFEAAGITVSEKKTDTALLLAPDHALWSSPLVIEAGSQRSIRAKFLCFSGLVNASAIMPEI